MAARHRHAAGRGYSLAVDTQDIDCTVVDDGIIAVLDSLEPVDAETFLEEVARAIDR